MPPTVALILWFILLLALLRFDPARVKGTSLALWIPVIWLFIVGSRLPSQWLGLTGGVAAQALEEGNPLDRVIYFGLILLSLGVLFARSVKWGEIVRRNIFIVLLLLFAMLSVVWSDFPFIAFKRWFRDLGNYLAILVVLTDPRPQEALCTVIRRLGYLLIPLSVLLTKYYIHLAIHYSLWTGLPEYVGASTSKNMLGVICLISGLFFFWDTVTRWPMRKEKPAKRVIQVNLAFLVMTLWLLHLSSSATSEVCMLLGWLLIWVMRTGFFKRHPTLVKASLPVSFCLYLILAYGFDLNGAFASQVGRDPTLTGRSTIWSAVLSMHTNPLVGTGYQTFWLGSRLDRVWKLAGAVNEAHNGYLETYLNLGLIGCLLLFLFLMASFAGISRVLVPGNNFASFAAALWTIVLFYNMTESAAFGGHYLWINFLLVTVVVSSSPVVLPEALPAPEISPRYRSKPAHSRELSSVAGAGRHSQGRSWR